MIANGYTEKEVQDGFVTTMGYDEFTRQPMHRRIMMNLLFGIIVRHPWLKIETAYCHAQYGFFVRLAGNRYGRTHIVYQFDETLRLLRWSYEDSLVVPIGLDGIRGAIEAVENMYRLPQMREDRLTMVEH